MVAQGEKFIKATLNLWKASHVLKFINFFFANSYALFALKDGHIQFSNPISVKNLKLPRLEMIY